MWPLRQYLLRVPRHRGKGLVARKVLLPLLPPPPATFTTRLAWGGTIALEFRETLGLSYLFRREFEPAEVEFLRREAKPGSHAVDVGANVGIFTLALASAVEPGKVLAFEPVPRNLERLKANLSLNHCNNVDVYKVALGDREDVRSIFVTDDAAYASMQESAIGRQNHSSLKVRVVTFDSVWREAGRPNVSVMKVDVEGAELSVLKGATEMLGQCSPVLMLEANTPAQLDALAAWLREHGYSHSQPSNFMKWNHVFTPEVRCHRPVRHERGDAAKKVQ